MICKIEQCNSRIMNKTHKLCQAHNWERLHQGQSYIEFQREKQKKSIKAMSDKRRNQASIYKLVRAEFVQKNPTCQVQDCKQATKDVHHKKGRIGTLLTDVRYFLAVCRKHHIEIETNPNWAKEQGYSLSRLT